MTEKEHKAVAEKIREEKTSSKKANCLEPVYKRAYKPNLPPEQWFDIYMRLGDLKCMEGVSPIHIRICVEVIENHRSTGELHRLAEVDENFQWLRSMQGNPMSIRQIQNILFRYFPEFQRPNRKRKQPKNAAIRKEETAIKREINQNVCHRCGSTEKIEIHHMIPVSMGGTNDKGNLIILCHECHKEFTKYLWDLKGR